MGEYTQITLDEWSRWKEDIRLKLKETAENFVYIGYRLTQIRDSGMLNGYENIFDFAKNEFGLEKSTTSRFIAIHLKFSEEGNPLKLKEEYASFGNSKLAEMLTLTDAECQLISERTTVTEIRELKRFNRQQEEPEESGEVAYTPLQKCIIDYFSNVKRRDGLNEIMRLRMEEAPSVKNEEIAAYHANPGEYETHKKGMIYLFMYDFDTGVKYKSMMEPEPISMTWTDFINEIVKIYEPYYSEDWNIWTNFYGIPAQDIQGKKVDETEENQGKTDAVATSQQKEKNTGIEESNGREKEDIIQESNPKEGEQESSEQESIDIEEDREEEAVEEEDNASLSDVEQAEPDKDIVVDSPLKKLRAEAERLCDEIEEVVYMGLSEEQISSDKLKEARRQAEQLAAVFGQILCINEEEENEG